MKVDDGCAEGNKTNEKRRAPFKENLAAETEGWINYSAPNVNEMAWRGVNSGVATPFKTLTRQSAGSTGALAPHRSPRIFRRDYKGAVSTRDKFQLSSHLRSSQTLINNTTLIKSMVRWRSIKSLQFGIYF